MALSHQAVAGIAGVTPAQLYKWFDRGLVLGHKSGACWSFTSIDALALAVMADLVRAGTRTEQAARAAEAIVAAGLDFEALAAPGAQPTWLILVEGRPAVTTNLQALLVGKSITVIAARLHITAKQIAAQIPATTTA